MAGIYIHIPFCKQACYYCDFYFVTTTKHKENFINALLKEIELTKDYLVNEPIETIYFGGGTPSLLTADEVNSIIDTIAKYHDISPLKEVTLEANPDDLTVENLKQLRQTPINRFSIGIQSFYDEDLKWMNRAHNANEAIKVVKLAQDNGFDNITIDLIYGTPTLTDERWQSNIDKALNLGIKHLSAYALTVEHNTPLDRLIKQGKYINTNDENTSRHFNMLLGAIKAAGWEQYEISNFALNENYSLHNTSYWQGKKYLGIGPAAHSFNQKQRSWNVSNLRSYVSSIESGELNKEAETLTTDQRVNEYILTSLRTKWGCNTQHIKEKFGENYMNLVIQNLNDTEEKKKVIVDNGVLILTDEGKLFADYIASELFI